MGLFSRRKTTTANPWAELVEREQSAWEDPAPERVPESEGQASSVPRGGRPVVEEPRTKRVSMSLTEAEHAAWTQAAGDERLSVWARQQVQAQLAVEQPNAGKAAELARLRADLARVGSNMNQLMRALNQWQVPATEELRAAVNGVWKELRLVRQELP